MKIYYAELDLSICAVFFVSASNEEEATEKILTKIKSEGYTAEAHHIKPIQYDGDSIMFSLNM